MNLGQILAQMKEAHREFERNNKHNFELFIIIYVAFPGQGHALNRAQRALNHRMLFGFGCGRLRRMVRNERMQVPVLCQQEKRPECASKTEEWMQKIPGCALCDSHIVPVMRVPALFVIDTYEQTVARTNIFKHFKH